MISLPHAYDEITPSTMALANSYQVEYETNVYDCAGQHASRKTPLQLIKQACLEGGATYEGRRQAVIYQTRIKHKVPIPIDPLLKMYAFPTHSPNDFRCTWLFYHQIHSIKPHRPNETAVRFHNNTQIIIPTSHYIVEKQMQRTALCIVRFSPQWKTNY